MPRISRLDAAGVVHRTRRGSPAIPGTSIELLTVTKKMPSDSFSLPAVITCPSALFGPGAICGSERNVKDGCYARKGSYAWAIVQRAQQARLDWVLSCQRADDRAGFTDTMVAAVRWSVGRQAGPRKVFRVHDSGDLFSPWYIDRWADVARALPDVRFWFPTRQWRSKAPAVAPALAALAALPNVVVRPSALFFGVNPPAIEGLGAGTTAADVDQLPMLPRDVWVCPASKQGGKCLDCRACWGTRPVVYLKH